MIHDLLLMAAWAAWVGLVVALAVWIVVVWVDLTDQ